ncbi:hypothetical protein [Microcoleus sp. OTE_8_concoct_300]|uniref:hypothetical protein n=1 Tax=Microcoleus sp. OTE_8_concoct_300 TaxID=2964710 RepID=UPI00403EFEDB
MVQNLQASLPYVYQDNPSAIALACATRISATGYRLLSEIVRCLDDKFDTSSVAVGDRFPIDTGFGIVTYRSRRLAPLP